MLDLYGAGTRSRTRDLLITSQLLYRLSYSGLKKTPDGGPAALGSAEMTASGDQPGWPLSRTSSPIGGTNYLHRQKAHVLPGVWVVVGMDQDSLKTDSPSLRFENPARDAKVQVHRDSRNEKAQHSGRALQYNITDSCSVVL